ncbi:hypothetical protein GCM10010517_22600 [Streptosporangium fragile]|uniref:Protein kinase domain-containing protein n=1 Tax=Streptosporangium fragile TaxID=46186 RepID=A0ABN3VV96_9ACTN
MSGGSFTDPFGAVYFTEALRAAETLVTAPAIDELPGYDIVRRITGPHAEVLVGRRPDGVLQALKGFGRRAPVSARAWTTHIDEALRLIRFGYGGLLPIEERLSLISGTRLGYLCLPYCQGGSLRNRLEAGDTGVAELAYHGMALVCALRKLHDHGVVHGDVKPENVLFAHWGDEITGEAVTWRTLLADLETLAPAGAATSWRMTPEYAAPEQLGGAPADPAMDIWAWGATLRDGLGPAVPREWAWLAGLVGRALSDEPAGRPTAAEIIDVYGRYVGFGDRERPRLGGTAGTAVVWYPMESAPSEMAESLAAVRHDAVHLRVSFGWAAWLPECARLYEVGSVPALRRIEELCTRVLGEPGRPGSLWRAFHDLPGDNVLPVGSGKQADRPGEARPIARVIPRGTALTFVRHLVVALVELVEATGAEADVVRLREVTEAWEAVGEFAEEADTAILAQAWLSLDDPERALPYVRHSYAADPDDPSARAAMHLFYVVSGDDELAAKVALQTDTEDMAMNFRWLAMAAVDLVEADDSRLLDQVLDLLSQAGLDVGDLLRCVLDGRRGPVRPDAAWVALREHFTAVSGTTSVQKLRYLVEAAYQRGEIEYAMRRARAVRAKPVIRRPVNHRDRAAVEAVALGRDPADRGLTARLNNRAELWSADGRPDDPLIGLCLVAAERWAGSAPVGISADVPELIEHSRALAGSDAAALLRGTRHCAVCRDSFRVEGLSVCGACHRLFCAGCVRHPTFYLRCLCGGDLAHPPGPHLRKTVRA